MLTIFCFPTLYNYLVNQLIQNNVAAVVDCDSTYLISLIIKLLPFHLQE